MSKIFLSVSCLAVILTLTLCSSQINAQVPAISKKYSEQKVYELMMRYNTSNKYNGAANAAVSKAFGRDFPNAYDIEWETNDEIYEVEFEIRNRLQGILRQRGKSDNLQARYYRGRITC